MANLHVMDSYQGPGEKSTAEYLAKHLPQDWHVIPNRKLPDHNQSDVDIWILSPTKLFVVEEKFWGPHLVIGDQRWQVMNSFGKMDERQNPLNPTSIKAKAAAGWLRKRIAEYNSVKGIQVLPIVILSNPALEWKVRKGYKLPDQVMALDEAVLLLTEMASRDVDQDFKNLNGQILSVLLDLDSPDQELSTIGDYEVTGELAGEKGLRIFTAEEKFLGDQLVLKCYDNSYWGSSSEGDKVIAKEVKALSVIKGLRRSWDYYLPFYFERKNWTVVPLVKPLGFVSFSELFSRANSATDILPMLRKNEVKIARDAYLGLSEIHKADVLHKALTPKRIWLGKSFRVIFSDFYLAHVDGIDTVVSLKDDVESIPHRPNESVSSLDFATTKTDVFGVALVLSRLHTGIYSDSIDSIKMNLQSDSTEYAKLLLSLLAEDYRERIEADEIVVQLDKLLSPIVDVPSAETDDSKPAESDPKTDLDEWEEGLSVLGARFELLQKLGAGGAGVTWKVVDTQDDKLKVLKRLHSKSLREHGQQEVANAQLLDHPGCAKVFEYLGKGIILSEYVEGVTLSEKATSPTFSPKNIRELSAQLLLILDYLHGKNLVHGDLSPKNIIVDDAWIPRLIDFGLLTKVGQFLDGGTRATISPETAIGKGVIAQSDLYSFSAGMVMLMLSRPPYAGDQNVLKNRDFTLAPLTEFEREQWGDEGVALLEVFFRACAPEISDRPESALAMLTLLQEAKPVPVEKIQPGKTSNQINEYVGEIRALYVSSRAGSPSSLGIASPFSRETYVPTLLDTTLMPDILAGKHRLVILTGNPGDGKTSYLEILEDEMKKSGGRVTRKTAEGWTISLAGRDFVAVLDASEATSEMSSDEIVDEALIPTLNGEQTALLAVNDGRLREFFDKNSGKYEEYAEAVERFFRNEDIELDDLVIVDLKTRNLVAKKDESLASRVIDQLAGEKFWSACVSCASQGICPILANRKTLQGPAKSKVLELLEISHLRRRKRATVRQVRSTLAWLITGDLNCQDVHSSPVDLTSSGKWAMQDLAFSKDTEDQLIQEWRQSDPALVLDVEVEKEVRRRPVTEDELFSGHDRYEREMRKLYFNDRLNSLSVYRYLPDYRDIITEKDNPKHLSKILLGISAVLGAIGYQGRDLMLTQSKSGSSWAIGKRLEAHEFELHLPTYDSRYLEVSPDYVELRHKSGASLKLNLDSFEIIIRASHGEIYGDRLSEVIRFEIDNFAKQLQRAKTNRLSIVQPNGETSDVFEQEGIIALEDGE